MRSENEVLLQICCSFKRGCKPIAAFIFCIIAGNNLDNNSSCYLISTFSVGGNTELLIEYLRTIGSINKFTQKIWQMTIIYFFKVDNDGVSKVIIN